jgi:hypothetical protein
MRRGAERPNVSKEDREAKHVEHFLGATDEWIAAIKTKLGRWVQYVSLNLQKCVAFKPHPTT